MGLMLRRMQLFKFGIFLKDEKGSLSVLILSLFMTILITLIIMTDLSSVYFAKRSLTQATEAAAQRGVRNLDVSAYYRGEYNVTKFFRNLTGEAEIDPGIPIDCEKGRIDSLDAINEFSRDRVSLFGSQIGAIRVDQVSCDGYQLSLRTSSTVQLPFLIPFINIDSVGISSHIGTFDERKITTNYYGINVGSLNQG
jgi:hypothetical protein